MLIHDGMPWPHILLSGLYAIVSARGEVERVSVPVYDGVVFMGSH